MRRPSPRQRTFLTELVRGNSKILLLNAKAGSGKTTTICMGVAALPSSYNILCVAFNTSIQTELADRLKDHRNCKVVTSNALGFRILKMNGYKPTIDQYKYSKIVTWCARNEWHMNPYDPRNRTRIESITKLVDYARMDFTTSPERIDQLADKHGLAIKAGDADKVLKVMRMGFNKRDVIDFVDQLYMAAGIPNLNYQLHDFVIVDECQDLSRVQQVLIRKVTAPNGRRVFVGDRRQSIYGFSGADTQAFDLIENEADTVMPLDVCYRCAPEIIERVGLYDDEIEAYEGNPSGEVNDQASVEELKPGDMVLCRNTLPLIALCFELARRQKPAYVKGNGIDKRITGFIDQLKARSVGQLLTKLGPHLEEYFSMLQDFNPRKSEGEIKQMSAYQLRAELVKMVSVIIHGSSCRTIKELKVRTKQLFAAKAGICLSTVHRAKGLEADRVFILEPDRMPSPRAKKDWQKQQERNLIYVAWTRPKLYLGFIADWSMETHSAAFRGMVSSRNGLQSDDQDYSRLSQIAENSEL